MHKTTLMILFVMISSSACTSGLNAGSGASGADGCGGGLGADAGSAVLESGGPGTEGPVVTADAVVVGDQALAGDRGSQQDETVGKDQALRKDQSVRKDQATVRDLRAPVSKEAAVAPPPASPGQLPTWVGLDWAAFPVDRGPAYPVSGRVWVVSTSGNDANAGTETSPLRAIATARTRAQSGDPVRVHGGTYAEGVAND